MARAACFRCDWVGETDESACPNCGTALYRSASEPVRERGSATPPQAPRDRGVRPPEAPRGEYLAESALTGAPGDPAPRRSHRFAAFVALALFLTGGVWWFLRAHEVPQAGDPAASPPPEGYLVYTAGQTGSQRLWSWDPRTGTATEGPALDGEVTQLVSAQGALTGWLGVTTRGEEGLLEASILRSQTADARPVHVFTADLVAWGPNGASVVSAGLGDTTNGCYATLKVYRERLDRGVQEPVYRRTQFCGRIPTIGQTFASTYFTWIRPHGLKRSRGVGVFSLGNGEPHRALRGWALVSVSPTSALLVRPAHGTGAALFWNGATTPEPYRSIDGTPIQVDEVLTWTVGADGALVVGTMGERPGLYLLDTTPGGDRVPRYIGVASVPAAATAAFDGSLYVAMQGRILVWRGDHLVEVDLPEGAPTPSGPLAWLPG
jgi:hypothetical protein